MQVQVLPPAIPCMPKAKYNAVAHIEVQGFDEEADGSVPLDVESALESDEALLPVQLASMLHGSCRRVDHLLGDGLWAHGAVGV